MHDYIERLEWLREYVNACIDHSNPIFIAIWSRPQIIKFFVAFVTKQGAGPLHPIRSFEDYIHYKKRQKLIQ